MASAVILGEKTRDGGLDPRARGRRLLIRVLFRGVFEPGHVTAPYRAPLRYDDDVVDQTLDILRVVRGQQDCGLLGRLCDDLAEGGLLGEVQVA